MSSLQQPLLHNTSSFATSSKYRKYVDKVLETEVGPLYVGVPNFWMTFFGGFQTVSDAVFKSCTEGPNVLFDMNGWQGWPNEANQEEIFSWLADIIEKLANISAGYSPVSVKQRALAQSAMPVQACTTDAKLDIGFIQRRTMAETRCHWSQILVPGQLRSNPAADAAPKAWLDLGRYASQIFAAQDDRRFVLSFTLCGTLMRAWTFDRLVGISFEPWNHLTSTRMCTDSCLLFSGFCG